MAIVTDTTLQPMYREYLLAALRDEATYNPVQWRRTTEGVSYGIMRRAEALWTTKAFWGEQYEYPRPVDDFNI